MNQPVEIKSPVNGRVKLKMSVYLIVLLLAGGCTLNKEPELKSLAREFRLSLENILKAWYPVTVDSLYGGFLTDLSHDWKASGLQDKILVSQSRHVWTTSQAAMFFGDSTYREMARHGYRFLSTRLLDPLGGGYYIRCSREGAPRHFPDGADKNPYGNAFAIYALSAYYEMSGDPSALELAKQNFYWLDSTCHDPIHGGYFADIRWREAYPAQGSSEASAGRSARISLKGQNTSLHILEAFTTLYRLWPDSLLQERLLEMLSLLRDVFTGEKGYLYQFMERDWTPVTYGHSSEEGSSESYIHDRVSFGHDIEAAYLMLEASGILGLEDDAKTLEIAKSMVDNTLDKGWDEQNGGIYYEGDYFVDPDSLSISNPDKQWWVQAEGLNSLLMMHLLFPEDERYLNAFLKQWDYIQTWMIDHQYGGWYRHGLDTNPEEKQAPKSTEWKINYHNTRALMNCIRMLEEGKAIEGSTDT